MLSNPSLLGDDVPDIVSSHIEEVKFLDKKPSKEDVFEVIFDKTYNIASNISQKDIRNAMNKFNNPNMINFEILGLALMFKNSDIDPKFIMNLDKKTYPGIIGYIYKKKHELEPSDEEIERRTYSVIMNINNYKMII